MADINFPNYFRILVQKIEDFLISLTEVEIAIIISVLFLSLVLLVCSLVIVVEMIVRCRTRTNAATLSAETYFKRSLKVSERMSKINTPEFKHFELELRRDSGNASIRTSRESVLESCFIDKCDHNEMSKHDIDDATGGVIV